MEMLCCFFFFFFFNEESDHTHRVSICLLLHNLLITNSARMLRSHKMWITEDVACVWQDGMAHLYTCGFEACCDRGVDSLSRLSVCQDAVKTSSSETWPAARTLWHTLGETHQLSRHHRTPGTHAWGLLMCLKKCWCVCFFFFICFSLTFNLCPTTCTWKTLKPWKVIFIFKK